MNNINRHVIAFFAENIPPSSGKVWVAFLSNPFGNDLHGQAWDIMLGMSMTILNTVSHVERVIKTGML